MGNLFTNMSLGKVAVSFTHTIKAMEPFFSVLLSAVFLGEVIFHPYTNATQATCFEFQEISLSSCTKSYSDGSYLLFG